MLDFATTFESLTGNPPFPWQRALYDDWFSQGKIPQSCNLPTGLGKTSVIAIWLIALANHPDNMPRRLVYVVNRRTVVDQTTDEVEKYRKNLEQARLTEPLNALYVKSQVDEPPLALSTLRGQFADNREWSTNPARSAVICGTVDMIGSRLLFSGYGVGFKGKPLHAGFLGQDALLVHDEAHLEPAFQSLIEAIRDEQQLCKEFGKFHVMELTATSRGSGFVFQLSDEDHADDEVKKRIGATKAVHLHESKDEKKLADDIAELALKHKDSGKAILVFTRKVDDVDKIVACLNKEKQSVQQLTGTLRGLERDNLVDDLLFQRFLPKAKPGDRTVYLICTSAGEVGVNISADHLVCDLSTFDSMAQRFGRVNRFGTCVDTQIDIMHPKEFKEDNLGIRLKKTLDLLKLLNGDGSPRAIGKLNLQARIEAFAPPPIILPATDFLFDAWSLTTIKGNLPSRPIIEPYLHGVEDEKNFDTEFAWREEVELLSGHVDEDDLAELLDEFPLKPHEILRIPTFGRRRAYEQLELIAARSPEKPAWVIEPDGKVTIYEHLRDLLAKKGKDYIVTLAARVVVLPPKAGGLTKIGTLDGDVAYNDSIPYDVAGSPSPKNSPLLRLKVIPGDEETSLKLIAPTNGWPTDLSVDYQPNQDRVRFLNDQLKSLALLPVKIVFRIDLSSESDDDLPLGKASEYLILKPVAAKKNQQTEPEWPALESHLAGVCQFAEAICDKLNLDSKLTKAVSLAAAWHDLGKGRAVWQRGAGNRITNKPVAKTLHGRPPENLNHFRHELGSMLDVVAIPEYSKLFQVLEPDQCELIIHLIATHHGRARPHFPADEAYDQERSSLFVDGVIREVPSRFANLVQKYGRWGLAYLESLLRAADALESRRIEATPIPASVDGCWPDRNPKLLDIATVAFPTPSITIAVDLTNPGQFFACCGLFELAHRLCPGAEAWFENDKFCIASDGTLNAVLDAFVGCCLTNSMTEAQHQRFEQITAMKVKERKATPGVEEEEKKLGILLREAPIVLKHPFNLTLDWFADDYAGGSRFKTWAGRQSVLDIASAMKDALNNPEWHNDACLSFSVKECGLPFNFDSDLGGQGGAIDVGFSFDPLAASSLTRIETSAKPALELLAFIGLQRFRPTEVKAENRFLYTAWNRPLPIQVAMPAACGAIPVAGASRYEFKLLYRTKYLKSFLPAIPFSGGSDE